MKLLWLLSLSLSLSLSLPTASAVALQISDGYNNNSYNEHNYEQSDRAFLNITAKSSGGGVPVGTIIAWPVATNPEDMENWLECKGQDVNAEIYPELWAVIGAKVPDLRGLFLRGYGSQKHFQNNGSTIGVTLTTHSSGLLNEVQGDAIRNIVGTMKSGTHMRYTGPQYGGAFTSRSAVSNYGFAGDFGSMFYGDPVDGSDPFFSAARVVPTSTENRPVNMAVRYLIRALP